MSSYRGRKMSHNTCYVTYREISCKKRMKISWRQDLESPKPQDVVGEVMNRAKCGSVDNYETEILPSFLLDEDESYQQGYEQAEV